MVRASRVDSVLIGDDFPEFGTDLVSTLSALDVYDFSHAFKLFICSKNWCLIYFIRLLIFFILK